LPEPGPGFTEEGFGVEVAFVWDFDDAVFYAVDFITLVQDFVVDESCPLLCGDEVRGVGGTGDGVE